MKTPICLLALATLAPCLWAVQPEKSDNPPQPAEAPSAPKSERRITIRHERGPGETENVPFLGVETARISPTLTAQLGLPEGAGLIVRSVVPNSPAAAVLRAHDVLLKLEDQLLVETHQLAVLIRQHKEGDEVTLTFVRAGKQETAKVKLALHAVPKLALRASFESEGDLDTLFREEGGAMPPEDLNRVLSLLDQRGVRAPEAGHRFAEIPGPMPHIRALKVHPANSNIVFTDGEGELALTIKEGKKTLVAKDAKGAMLYSGPIDTPEQRAALPDKVRDRLEQIESMEDFSFRAGNDLPNKLRVLKPSARRMQLPRQLRTIEHRQVPAAI